ncbi:phage exclusion lipoprotein Cor [Rahnella aceris]
MTKIMMAIGLAVLVSGCSGILEKQHPVCSGTALIGGQETSVQIYGVRQVAHQTQYQAGYPFGWRWVSKTNFIRTTCDK